MLDTINLSILDFKGPSTSGVRVEQLAINLSILDFKVGCWRFNRLKPVL